MIDDVLAALGDSRKPLVICDVDEVVRDAPPLVGRKR